MKIGVLALQGSIKEHIKALKKCGEEPVLVKKPEDVDNIYGLIIPGGESTTIGKLMHTAGLDKEIKRLYARGIPIYGTCAGAIVMAKYILEVKQPKLGLIDITIKRNDYGRQIDSFETMLDIKGFDKPFKGVFIRAPVIEEVHNGVEVLSKFKDKPVLAEKDNVLVSTFHPELTDDLRLHKYFIDMIKRSY